MGISTIGVASGTPSLNRSQVFTSSGNFTVPSGVTYVHAVLRGGNGGFASNIFRGSNGGSAGGNTTFSGVTATGGPGGLIRADTDQLGSQTGVAAGQGPGHDAVTISFYTQVTPGASLAIVIGSGGGAFATISWAV